MKKIYRTQTLNRINLLLLLSIVIEQTNILFYTVHYYHAGNLLILSKKGKEMALEDNHIYACRDISNKVSLGSYFLIYYCKEIRSVVFPFCG